MDSQECLFNMDDNISIDFSAKGSNHGNENQFRASPSKEPEHLHMNIKEELEHIPQVDEDLLANHKLSEYNELELDLYNQDGAKEHEFQSLFYENCTQPGRECYNNCKNE